VQRGETAFAIGRRYGLSVRDLVAANPGLDPARLKAGQRLNLSPR
jgi:LysM repeat protein